MLCEIDLNGGAGGSGGAAGRPGQGGQGGEAGSKREIGKTYKARGITREVSMSSPYFDGKEVVQNTQKFTTLVAIENEEIPLYAYGQKGKTGRAGRANVDTRDRGLGGKGKDGRISFVLYGDEGIDETGGSPYRLIFANDDIENIKLTPIIDGVPTKELRDALVYGQRAEFGKIAPANVGDLTSPPSQVCV